MANHDSARKAIRKIETRTALNRSRISRIRTFIKKLESFLSEGNKAEALSAFRMAESEIMRGVTKGTIHKNTASRKVSRLSKRVKALAAA
jgi:small subunit ribosomal protein S20